MPQQAHHLTYKREATTGKDKAHSVRASVRRNRRKYPIAAAAAAKAENTVKSRVFMRPTPQKHPANFAYIPCKLCLQIPLQTLPTNTAHRTGRNAVKSRVCALEKVQSVRISPKAISLYKTMYPHRSPACNGLRLCYNQIASTGKAYKRKTTPGRPSLLWEAIARAVTQSSAPFTLLQGAGGMQILHRLHL